MFVRQSVSRKNNLVLPEKVTLINPPVFYSEECYARSIEKVINYLSQFKEIAAIYQIGGISDPGISDIDLIVIFRNEIEHFDYSCRQIFDKQDNYLFMHGLFGMPLNIFEEIDYLIPIFNCKKLIGVDISRKSNITEDDNKTLTEVYSAEYLVVNLFNLVSQFTKKQLKVRNLLCSLKALTYDLEILGGNKKGTEPEDFIYKIHAIREHWWNSEGTRDDKFIDLCKQAVSVIFQTIHDVSSISDGNEVILNEPSWLRVGPNGYILPKRESEDNAHDMIIKTNIILNLIEIITRDKTHSRIITQLNDLKTAFYAILLSVPVNFFSILAGKSMGSPSTIIEKRQILIQEYVKFMKKVHSDFGVFDIFRWHISDSKKWNLIRSINMQLFIHNIK